MGSFRVASAEAQVKWGRDMGNRVSGLGPGHVTRVAVLGSKPEDSSFAILHFKAPWGAVQKAIQCTEPWMGEHDGSRDSRLWAIAIYCR